MRWRGRVVLLVVMAVVATAGATAWATDSSTTSPPVALRLPNHTLRAGQSVQVTIINRSSRQLLISGCFLLQLRDARGWKTITSTHGVHVPCSLTNGVPLPAAPIDHWSLILYDDLAPGAYRITMAYKVLPKHWRTASLHHGYRLLRDNLRVLRFRPGPAPKIAESRIRRIALKAASGGHATLIQHAEGTRFEANLLAGGALIYDWTWAYLIAIKGHFKTSSSGSGGFPYGPRKARSHAETYSVVTLVLNAKTGRGEDFGISNSYPDLAKLGAVTTDYRP